MLCWHFVGNLFKKLYADIRVLNKSLNEDGTTARADWPTPSTSALIVRSPPSSARHSEKSRLTQLILSLCLAACTLDSPAALYLFVSARPPLPLSASLTNHSPHPIQDAGVARPKQVVLPACAVCGPHAWLSLKLLCRTLRRWFFRWKHFSRFFCIECLLSVWAAVPGQARRCSAEASGQHQRAEEGTEATQQQEGPKGEARLLSDPSSRNTRKKTSKSTSSSQSELLMNCNDTFSGKIAGFSYLLKN